MGWTEKRANNFKNGVVDRKAELIEEFTESNDKARWEVLKCSMVGSTAYMAIKYENKTEPSKNCVFAVVCLTSVRDKYWFAYKDMEETSGPFNFDCPKCILDMLTPTDNKIALAWREDCRNNKKNNPIKSQLSRAKEGSKIQITYSCDTKLAKKGTTVVLVKRCYSYNARTNRRSYQWLTTSGYTYYVPVRMIENHNPQWVEFIK